MLNSALNFAMGFFGLPIEDKYQQSITIEQEGVRFLSLIPGILVDSQLSLIIHLRHT